MAGRSRRWVVAVAGAAVLAGLTWAAVRSPAAAEPSPDPDRSALPYLWQWRLNQAPPAVAGTDGMHLILRHQAEPFPTDAGPPPARKDPLGIGEGADRILMTEPLGGLRPDMLRVGLQVIDLRTIGVKPTGGEPPIRLVAGFEFGRSRTQSSGHAEGYTIRAATPHPADAWTDGELPLLTLVTLNASEQFTYTFLLAAGPMGQ
jgi:hypothetical protein